MEGGTTTCESRDILSTPLVAFLVWWLPAIAIAITGSSHFGAGWRTVVWTVALGTMGTACLANAARCQRVHCYITGPFFLLMAVVSLLYGLGLVPLGGHGWSLIGLTILVGGVALCYLPELFLGKYRIRRA